MIWFINVISMRDSKAIILVQHYGLDIDILFPFFFRESLGKGYR